MCDFYTHKVRGNLETHEGLNGRQKRLIPFDNYRLFFSKKTVYLWLAIRFGRTALLPCFLMNKSLTARTQKLFIRCYLSIYLSIYLSMVEVADEHLTKGLSI